MKIRNVSLDHGYARTRGWVGPDAAASTGLISIGSDIPPTGGPFTSLSFPGQLVDDQGGGLASVDVRAIIGELLNDSGSDLVAGTVGVIDTSSGEFVTTTTARDTRPVGVVVGPIATGATGFVQFSGFAPVVNVVTSVTAGDYGETSGTGGEAQGSGTTRESGSFCIFTSSGTTPSAYLWGMTDAVTGTPGGSSITVSDGSVLVDPVSALRVPTGGVGDDGGGQAYLRYLTDRGGAQDALDSVSSSGAAVTLDCAIANAFDITLTANCTFTIANPPVAGVLGQILVARRQGGVGSFLETWPASVKWQAADGTLTGSAPTLHTAVDAVDVVLLSTVDGGVTWGATALGLPGDFSGFATPAIVLGTAAAAGSATTAVRSDATIVAFDATAPTTSAIGDSAATGSAAKAARRDHVHGREALSTATPLVESGSGAVGTGTKSSREDHVHPVASSGGVSHAHVDNVLFSGTGSQTVWELPVAPLDAYSIAVFVANSRSQDWTLSGTMLTTITFGAAPASGTNNIAIDIDAQVT